MIYENVAASAGGIIPENDSATLRREAFGNYSEEIAAVESGRGTSNDSRPYDFRM